MINKSNTSYALKALHQHLVLLTGEGTTASLKSFRIVKFVADIPNVEYVSISIKQMIGVETFLDITVYNGKLEKVEVAGSLIDNLSSFIIKVQHEILNHNAEQ